MGTGFILELSEVINSLSNEEFHDYLESENFFFSKYSSLKESYLEFKEQRKQDPRFQTETWNSLLREIRLWKDLNLSYMYSQLMKLVQEFKGNHEYFEIKTDYGSYIVPDRITLLNKLFSLHRELVFEIVPDIEKSLNYEPDIAKVRSQTIHGKIDWHDTIVNSINQSLPRPVTFTSIIPTQEFDTPENLLLLTTIFWLQNDAKRLLNYHQPKEFSKKELMLLQNIIIETDSLLSNTLLSGIKEQAKVLSSLNKKGQKIEDLQVQTKDRITIGLVRQPDYQRLLDWIMRYLHFNTERFTKDLVNFRIERTEDVDRMYELWILFEMMWYLQKNFFVEYEPIVESAKEFHGFNITLMKKKFRLKYQESYPGQIHVGQTPDYTLEINDTNIPLVMDAKNWRTDKSSAIDRMVVYLVDMFSKKTFKGILFFPNNSGLIDNQSTPFFEKPIKIGEHDCSLITCVLTPSNDSEIQKQNDIVFKKTIHLLEN